MLLFKSITQLNEQFTSDVTTKSVAEILLTFILAKLSSGVICNCPACGAIGNPVCIVVGTFAVNEADPNSLVINLMLLSNILIDVLSNPVPPTGTGILKLLLVTRIKATFQFAKSSAFNVVPALISENVLPVINALLMVM